MKFSTLREQQQQKDKSKTKTTTSDCEQLDLTEDMDLNKLTDKTVQRVDRKTGNLRFAR